MLSRRELHEHVAAYGAADGIPLVILTYESAKGVCALKVKTGLAGWSGPEGFRHPYYLGDGGLA